MSVMDKTGWRPIETAPKDGTWVLTFTPTRVPQHAVMRWVIWATPEQDKWETDDGKWFVHAPHHWQPLTSP